MRLHVAYIAGLVDGDGSITAAFQKQANARWVPALGIDLRIFNQDQQVLEEIRETFGCGRIRASVTGFSGVYVLEIPRRQLRVVLEQLLPYLRVKAEQAELALLGLSAVRAKGGRNRVTAEMQAFRTTLVERMTELNQRNGKAFRKKWRNSVDLSPVVTAVGDNTEPSR